MSVIDCWNRYTDMFFNCVIFVRLNKRKSQIKVFKNNNNRNKNKKGEDAARPEGADNVNKIDDFRK